MTRKTCCIADCKRSVVARGWCREHYYRWKRNGDPMAGRASQGAPMRWLRAHVTHTGKECLIWPFRRAGRGYAYLQSGPACRVMCRLAHGKAPSTSHQSAHSCGMGHLGCINPTHLRWATRHENEQDKTIHGTRLRGSQMPWAKLTEKAVLEIRRLKGKTTQEALAERFAVSRSTIGLIQSNATWRHVNA